MLVESLMNYDGVLTQLNAEFSQTRKNITTICSVFNQSTQYTKEQNSNYFDSVLSHSNLSHISSTFVRTLLSFVARL
jgi:hypothetical protein